MGMNWTEGAERSRTTLRTRSISRRSRRSWKSRRIESVSNCMRINMSCKRSRRKRMRLWTMRPSPPSCPL